MALFAVLMVVTGFTKQPPPAQQAGLIRGMLYLSCALFAAIAIWAAATGIGLLLLRRWSRISLLVFAALLAIFAPVTAVTTLAMPMPEGPGATAQLMAAVKIGIVAFYLVLALGGAGWLYYFTRPGVRAQFEGDAPISPGARPLSISIIGWFTTAGGAFSILAGWFVPVAVIFGFVMRGQAAHLYYAIFGALYLITGISLLRLKSWSRMAAIVIYGIGALNSLLFVLIPGSGERLRTVYEAVGNSYPAMVGYERTNAIMMVVGALLCIVPMWFLHARRAAFTSTTSSPVE